MFSLRDDPGLFVLAGYGHAPQLALARPLAHVEGCRSLIRPFGEAGTLFLYTTHRDVAEDDEALVVNLGLARDGTTGRVLSARDLLDRRLVTPDGVAHDKLTGNTAVLCVSKREPRACLFRSIAGAYVLLYHQSDGTFVCSDVPSLLMPFLPRLEIPADAYVHHFLFRTVAGPMTYLRDMYRLEHGHQARWTGTELRSELVQDVRSLSSPTVRRLDDGAISAFYERAGGMVAAYVSWLRQRGYGFATLLSGGVDSSTLQVLINRSLPEGETPRSFSYAMLTPMFAYEVENARSASAALGTEHRFVEVGGEDYPDLLRRATEIIGRPVGHEFMPCQVAVARHLAAHRTPVQFLFIGVASDTLLGTDVSRRLRQLDVARKVPLAGPVLRAAAAVLGPVLPGKAYGSRELARLLAALGDEHSPVHPLNSQALFTDLEMAERCFGGKAVRGAFAYRRNVAAAYFETDSVLEHVHLQQLVTPVADDQTFISRMYAAHRRTVLYPYLDREFMQLALAVDPRVRFYDRGRTKPIVKRILEVHSDYPDVDRPKGHSGFDRDLWWWMKEGPLSEMVHAMERPAFMTRSDFERKLERPDWFTWNMLILDLFRRYLLHVEAGAMADRAGVRTWSSPGGGRE